MNRKERCLIYPLMRGGSLDDRLRKRYLLTDFIWRRTNVEFNNQEERPLDGKSDSRSQPKWQKPCCFFTQQKKERDQPSIIEM